MDNNKKSPNEEQGYAEEQGKIDAKKLQFYENSISLIKFSPVLTSTL